MSALRVIIAGSRSIQDLGLVNRVMCQVQSPIASIVCGKANGADTMGELWARINGIQVDEYPADWDRFGKGAGFQRNRQMIDNADALVAFWDGTSLGTAHSIDLAQRAGLNVWAPDLTKLRVAQPIQIVNRHHNLPFDVYIGRGSVWGNPFSHLPNTTAQFRVKDRMEAVVKYREYILQRPDLLSQMHTLRGKTLGCYCFPKACHGHILGDLAENGNLLLKKAA